MPVLSTADRLQVAPGEDALEKLLIELYLTGSRKTTWNQLEDEVPFKVAELMVLPAEADVGLAIVALAGACES